MQTHFYSSRGQYGTSRDRGDLMIVELQVNEAKKSTASAVETRRALFQNKQLLLLVDVSGSMLHTLPYLKASLLAVQNEILGMTKEETDRLGTADTDQLLRYILPMLQVVAFASDAKMVWSATSSTETFQDMVMGLEAGSGTNLEAALVLAFAASATDHCQWIVTMTDGEPTEGEKTPEKIGQLIREKQPDHSTMMSIGYKKNVPLETMQHLGSFTSILKESLIPVVFGSIVSEIRNTWGIHATVDMHARDIVAGDLKIGSLYSGRRFVVAARCTLDDGKEPTGSLTYTEVKTGKQVVQTLKWEGVDAVPSTVRSAFFLAEFGRYLKRIPLSNDDKKALEEWKQIKEAKPFLKQFDGFECLNPSSSEYICRLKSQQTTCASQSSHVDAAYQTLDQAKCSDSSSSNSAAYQKMIFQKSKTQ